MTNATYIVTRNRLYNLLKAMPRWLNQQDIVVYFVVEAHEQRMHRQLIQDQKWDNTQVIVRPYRNKGLGYARNYVVRHAQNQGYKTIILSDDDLMPSKTADTSLLHEEAAKPNVLGIGAVRSYHDFMTGGITKENNIPILCPSGWGMQLYGLNVENAIHVGNFDVRLDCSGEDHELVRQGIAHGFPWLVHCGVYADALGKRYDPGGINSLYPEIRKQREKICHEIMYQKWPKYVSHPSKNLRTSWSKMMDDYIPNWRELSLIHGGSLDL